MGLLLSLFSSTFKCNFDSAKSCFLRALYSKVSRLASGEVVLSLLFVPNAYQYVRLKRVRLSYVADIRLNLM